MYSVCVLLPAKLNTWTVTFRDYPQRAVDRDRLGETIWISFLCRWGHSSLFSP